MPKRLTSSRIHTQGVPGWANKTTSRMPTGRMYAASNRVRGGEQGVEQEEDAGDGGEGREKAGEDRQAQEPQPMSWKGAKAVGGQHDIIDKIGVENQESRIVGSCWVKKCCSPSGVQTPSRVGQPGGG